MEKVNDLEERTIIIEGLVENVLFKNENNGYIVFELDAGGDLVTAVGEIGEVDEGEKLRLEGRYITHPKFGQQFAAEYCERMLPSTAAHIQKYLSSGAIKGIGPSLAKKIVSQFGDRTLEIMENTPEKLLEIKGISPAKCENITNEVRQIFNLRSLMTFLNKFGIKAKYAMKSFKKWGYQSMEVIQDNPYLLCSYGVELEFRKAEAVADSFGIDRASSMRIKAGITFILLENANSGHTCLPLDRLEGKVCEFLEITIQDFKEAYNEEINEENLFEYIKKERIFVYLADFYKAETYIAGRLGVISAFSSPDTYDYNELINDEEKKNNIKYESLQRLAISKALSKGMLILTGGPGTGKTTTLNAIISMYEKKGETVMIAAPTGRAAKRISDLTGYEARTIHRMLEVSYDMDGKLRFIHDENNPLACDVLIIDEMSMVDSLLFESLLRALRINCRLVMVGDSDQLPSVGAGNVLKDMIDSRRLPVVELKEIFRQAQKSCIITNSHKIVNGIHPDLTQKNNDFFFFQRFDSEKCSDFIKELYCERLPKAYGFSAADDIQVLCPSRKGLLGVIELNKKLQNEVNPPSREKSEVKSLIYTFRLGDKVMQTKNNYDIEWKRDDENSAGIFNGDIGKIVSINKLDREAVIDFDGRCCIYSFDILDQLELAYAVTVHKSQGSEFDVVILPLLGGFEKLYYRNLLYTAVTRAKKLLIIVGSSKKVFQMVDNDRRTLRYTCLEAMIADEIEHECTD
ncbi:MAG: ATP-dependent RecD-like DNA helicase [Oscillospiraceae bacterium]|nr:ATP-dependent RecD-like DNA helicase [Oscillospiraceae bacterium]